MPWYLHKDIFCIAKIWQFSEVTVSVGHIWAGKIKKEETLGKQRRCCRNLRIRPDLKLQLQKRMLRCFIDAVGSRLCGSVQIMKCFKVTINTEGIILQAMKYPMKTNNKFWRVLSVSVVNGNEGDVDVEVVVDVDIVVDLSR